MKEHDVKLTLQETEQLCRLYMDCRLTVLEETELQYLLGKMPYSSPCIDEVRMLMELHAPAVTPVADTESHAQSEKRPRFNFRASVWNVAASIAIISIVALSVLTHNPAENTQADTYCVAYANGVALDSEQAARQVEADMKRAEALMKHFDELEAKEQRMIDDYINLNFPEQ